MQTVLKPAPARARYLTLNVRAPADARDVLAALVSADERTLVGLGAPLLEALGAKDAGVAAFPARWPLFPSTQAALWLGFVHGDESREHDAVHALLQMLGERVSIVDDTACFTYKNGRDLSGYTDGIENPTGKKAERTALRAPGPLAGASVVLVQRWVHDLTAMARMSDKARDDVIGRRRKDDKELADAPPSAHVKRTAQEGFSPEAFMVRRSMPWSDARGSGLYFIAYAAEQDTHERQLHRMAGHEDGVVDALFSFTRPVTSAFFLCPARKNGRLDVRALARA